MKKIAIIVCALLIAVSAFADVIIKQDYEGVGLSSFKLNGNCNPQITERESSDFSTYNGLSLAALYEFNSEQDTPFHYYAGFDTGFCTQGISSLVVGGFTAKLAEFGPCLLELDTALKAGASFGITNTLYPAAQADIMFNIMRTDRKGIFAGIGITDQFIDMTFPSLFKKDNYTINYAGMIFAAGYRF